MVPFNLHLVVAARRPQSLPAQQLPPAQEPLGVASRSLAGLQPHLAAPRRDQQVLVGRGDVKGQAAAVWNGGGRRMKVSFGSDSFTLYRSVKGSLQHFNFTRNFALLNLDSHLQNNTKLKQNYYINDKTKPNNKD